MLFAQISVLMDKFEKQFDDLDVRSGFMEGAMGEATSTSTPQGEVDSLVSQVAAKAGLDLADQLSGAGTVGTSVATAAPAAAAPGTLRIVSFDPHTPPAPRYGHVWTHGVWLTAALCAVLFVTAGRQAVGVGAAPAAGGGGSVADDLAARLANLKK